MTMTNATWITFRSVLNCLKNIVKLCGLFLGKWVEETTLSAHLIVFTWKLNEICNRVMIIDDGFQGLELLEGTSLKLFIVELVQIGLVGEFATT